MGIGTMERRSAYNNSCQNIASDVICVTTKIANVCLIGQEGAGEGEWVLVDTGLANSKNHILDVAIERFGSAKPAGIILTHGHFDHVGAVKELVERWDVPVYAHELEIPFLTGKKDYPEPDPTVGGGLMATMSFMYPNDAIDLGSSVKALPADGSIPILSEWRYIHTPGHTEGHISLFRESDKVLISGDAFITAKQESAIAVLMQEHEVNGPPSYFTVDWDRARESVKKLEALKPSFVIPGHGQPMCGEELSNQLKELADNFNEIAVPEQGRYVHK